MENNFLLVIGAHQDTDRKISTVINLLKYLKEENIDTCFSTHSYKGLEEISKYSKYCFYDEDNTFLSEDDLINSLEHINQNLISTRWTEWFTPMEGLSLITKFARCPHQKSALKIIKNGVSCADQNGYGWIVYMEYDILPPAKSLKEIIKDKIIELNELEMDSFLLWNQRNPSHDFLSGGFFITRVKKIKDNTKFMSPWYKSSKDWYSHFGNRFFEEIMEEFMIGPDKSKTQIEGEIDFWKTHWGENYIKDINVFDISDSEKNYELEKILSQDKMKISFYVKEIEGLYDLDIWAFNVSGDLYHISELKIEETNELGSVSYTLVEEFDVHTYGWRLIRSYKGIKPDYRLNFSLSYKAENTGNKFTYDSFKKISGDNLKKLSLIKIKK
jgi:hypothetical protein